MKDKEYHVHHCHWIFDFSKQEDGIRAVCYGPGRSSAPVILSNEAAIVDYCCSLALSLSDIGRITEILHGESEAPLKFMGVTA